MAVLYLYFVLAACVAMMAMIRGRSGVRWFLLALFASPLIAGLFVVILPPQEIDFEPGDESLRSRRRMVVPMPNDATIRVVQSRLSTVWPGPYEIFANGAQIGTVDRESAVDFPVPSGQLSIVARDEWGDSRPLRINTSPDRGVEIEIARHGGRFRAAWAMVFGLTDYLTLRQMPATHAVT